MDIIELKDKDVTTDIINLIHVNVMWKEEID